MVSKWDLENSDATTQSGDTSDDDLGYPRNTPKKWRHRMENNSGGVSSSEQPGLGRKACSAKNPIAVSVNQEVISLSDDEFSDIKDFDDGAAAYEKFKNKKSLQRKQAAARTRRAKGVTQNPTVGKRPANTEANTSSRKRQRQLKEYGELSSDDDMMGHILPSYIQNRRSAFDKKTVLLKEAGLKLPPSFDDVEFSDDEHLEDLKEKPDFQKATPSRSYEDIQLPYSLGLIPAPIAQWLRDYQVRGVEFLHELFVYQKGGILGDDMGLGKSVQVIAFLTAAYGKTGDERDAKRMRKMRRKGDGVWYPRTLIVCPGTLLQNWKSELDRWGWWLVEIYHGAGKEAALQSAASGRVEIMLTTYKTYVLNKGALNMVEWDCVVADECHIIKERKSETTQSMNEINALCRIGLTGTAIQNKYEELWTLLNWTNPGKFGPVSTWKSTICDPLKLGQSHDATTYQLSKARKTAKKLVNNLLPPFFLRRMKTLIADQLPKKSDRVVFCPLTPTQADAYERVLDSDIIKYIKMSSDPCSCGSGKKSGWCCRMYLPQGGKWQSYVFPAISNLQKLSNHLAILIPQSQDPSEKQDKDLEMLQIALPDQWRQLYATRDSILNYANHEFCGKWKVLKKLLKWWHRNGDKVLVFSHNVRLLKMLQMLFKHTSYNVSYLDGSMTYDNRAKAVDNFNADPREFVFLISTRAGGIGLNITSANKVVVVDPNWNPAFDLQAQDRAYRIGQSRDVEVFRLISAGTIEEIVYARQIYKQQQANIGYTASTERRYFKGIQEKKDRRGEIFGLSNMFQYQGDNIVLRDIVHKTNVAESKVGVKIVELELDETNDGLNKEPFPSPNDEENDDAMSQLAAMIRGEEVGDSNENTKNVIQAKHDPIQAILAGAGVKYTHENSEVIGSSKIEERLSRRAEMAADGASFGEEQVFQGSQDDVSSGFDVTHGGKRVRFKYHPPEDVKRRQFCSMAKRFGFDSPTEFALVVEGMSQAQRRGYLAKWYRECQSMLMSGTNTPVQEEDVSLLNSIPKQQTPG
ncbi:hypothetical protein GX48_00212 [Paracoccidioides brasiliensis]|nr:hypothetical protein GX48_00212 [Paracoccidioides brasiliensis]